MLIFDDRFKYPDLKRMTTNEGRRYVTPTGFYLPSVTTILSETKTKETKEGLAKWAKRVGVDEAERIKNQAAGLGTLIHENLERYMLGQEMKFGGNLVHKMAKAMTEKVIEHGFSKIDKIFGQEVNLYYDELYAGTADLIIEVGGQMMIADFKNTIKMKKEEYLTDYYIQCVAYALAHNNMFGTNINRGKIMMVARPDENMNCEYKEFDLDPVKFSKYEDMWLDKLDLFYANK